MTSSNGKIFRFTDQFVWRIHRSPHKSQWRGALMFSLICVWINSWVNYHEAGDLKHDQAHYDVNVMFEADILEPLGIKCFFQPIIHWSFKISITCKYSPCEGASKPFDKSVLDLTLDSKVHGANMGPTWVLSAPDGPHVGSVNLAIRELIMMDYFGGWLLGLVHNKENHVS